VVEDPNADELQGIFQLAGDGSVCRTGFGDTAWMIVRKDDRGCVDGQRCSEHFPDVDARAVDGAAGQLLGGKDPVPVVEPDRIELFVHRTAESHPQEVCGIAGIAHAALAFQPGQEDAFDGGQHIGPGGLAGEAVSVFAVFDDAHVLSLDAGLRRRPSASETKKASSTRSRPPCGRLEGGKDADEGTLARIDVKRCWPTAGASQRWGKPFTHRHLADFSAAGLGQRSCAKDPFPPSERRVVVGYVINGASARHPRRRSSTLVFSINGARSSWTLTSEVAEEFVGVRRMTRWRPRIDLSIDVRVEKPAGVKHLVGSLDVLRANSSFRHQGFVRYPVR